MKEIEKRENRVTKEETSSKHNLVMLQLRGLEVTFNIVGVDRDETVRCWDMMTQHFNKALGQKAGFPGFAIFGLSLDMKLLDYPNTTITIEAVNPATRILHYRE